MNDDLKHVPDRWSDSDDDLIEAAWGLIAVAVDMARREDQQDWLDAFVAWRMRYCRRLDRHRPLQPSAS